MSILLLSMICAIYTFDLPGIRQRTYSEGQYIPVLINEMTSESTQLPYDYYDLDICKPQSTENQNQNIGSMILGTLSQQSKYYIFMNYEITDEILCTKHFTQTEQNNLKWFIDHDYRVNMLIDELPILSSNSMNNTIIGVPLGIRNVNQYSFYNHYNFNIEIYNTSKSEINQTFIINSITVEFESKCMDSSEIDSGINCPINSNMNVTYSVRFLMTNSSNRWSAYLNIVSNTDQEWMPLSVTLYVFFGLTCLIALFIRFTIKRDVLTFEMLPQEESDGQFDQKGWKQISRDVFRPPAGILFLSVLIGTGIQFTIMTIYVFLVSSIGFLYSAHTGYQATLVIVVYVFTGGLNGYYSSKFYKYFKGEYWLLCTLGSNLAFPIMALFIFGIENIALMFEEASSGLDFKSAITFIALQLGIQTPLNLIGSLIGFKTESPKNPCRYGQIAQEIPQQPFYLDYFYSCLIGGFVCFISIGLEISQIMQSIWKNSYYEFFVSLLFTAILLIIISAEVSILTVYFLLQHQNHRWWWKAFFVPFTSGVYLFIYSIQYYLDSLQFTRFSTILYYFGTMYMVSLCLGLICGTVGFLASHLFVKKIYSMVKLD
ncbi:unnamed protein product [Paramecium octaurelia]|uniref:Transmembrane 9 superfamily member n=1 Tax=Paramecium octaurelia TaxID=43137 RepID=A0A8S1X9D5_PAROT|nr:unnamed protein product [Paramecium octaurelia]